MRLVTGKVGYALARLRTSLCAIAIIALIGLFPLGAPAQVANDDNYTVEQNSRNNRLDVLDNDTISSNSAFILGVTQPSAGGETSLSANRRVIQYTPPPGFTGTETFRYTLFSSGFWSAIVTVQVVGDNEPPRATDDSYETTAGTRLDVGAAAGVLSNDSDPNNDTLTATIDRNASDGTVTLRPDGSFTYVPAPGFAGQDRFDYRVSDGRGGTDTGRVDIQVINPDDAPVIGPIPAQTAYVATPFAFDVSSFVSDEDTPASELRYAALSTYPNGLTISPLGQISGMPGPGTVGSHTIRFSVSDATSTVSGQFTLVIEEVPVADLAISVEAAPNPVTVGAAARWTLRVTNQSNFPVDAVVEGRWFTSAAPFNIDQAIPPACTLAPDGMDITVRCAIDVLTAGAVTSLEFTGSGPAAGDVFGAFSVRSEVRDEADPTDNEAAAALSVAGTISRTTAQTITGFAVSAIASGDLNGDGFGDLVAATDAGESVLAFLNVADPLNARKRLLDGTPIPIGDAAADTAVAVADLDGDADADIVAAGAGGSPVRIYLNEGGDTFTLTSPFAPGVAVSAMATADIDGDGFVDLVIAGNGRNLLSLGTGVPGGFSAPQAFGDASAAALAVADLFGDSRPEIVVANADGDATIYAFDAGTVSLATTLPTGPTTSVTASDFSGDGSVDLLFGRDRAAAPPGPAANPLFLNTSLQTPEFVESAALGAAATLAVLAADTDDDNQTDAIVLNGSGAHQVFRNSGLGDGTFLLAPVQLAAAGTRAAMIGLINADGRVDLAVVETGGIAIYFGDGTGGFGAGDVTPPTITLVGAADLKTTVGDPFTDPGIVAVDATDGDVSASLLVSSTVDTTLIGNYVVTYQVWDSSGNPAVATRSVEVTPRAAVGGGGGGALGITIVLLLVTLSLIMRSNNEDEDS